MKHNGLCQADLRTHSRRETTSQIVAFRNPTSFIPTAARSVVAWSYRGDPGGPGLRFIPGSGAGSTPAVASISAGDIFWGQRVFPTSPRRFEKAICHILPTLFVGTLVQKQRGRALQLRTFLWQPRTRAQPFTRRRAASASAAAPGLSTALPKADSVDVGRDPRSTDSRHGYYEFVIAFPYPEIVI